MGTNTDPVRTHDELRVQEARGGREAAPTSAPAWVDFAAVASILRRALRDGAHYGYRREFILQQALALEAIVQQSAEEGERDWLADDHAHICSKLAEQYKSDPVLFAALTDAAAIIRDLMRELRRETERRWEGNRRAAQEYVDDMRDVFKEAARVCKDLDDEALAKEGRLACGAECAAAIADLAARMNVRYEVNHE